MKFILMGLLFSVFAPAEAPKNCNPDACDKSRPNCEKGESLVALGAGEVCCPRYVCQSRRTPPRNCTVTCQGTQPVCGDGQKAVNKATDGACCPNWACEAKDLKDRTK